MCRSPLPPAGTFPRKREKDSPWREAAHINPLPLAGEGDQRSWWRGEQRALTLSTPNWDVQ